MDELDRSSTSQMTTTDLLSSNGSLWGMLGLLIGGSSIVFAAGMLSLPQTSFVMYFAGATLLLDILFFSIATFAVVTEYLATKNYQFRIITVMAVMVFIGLFITATRNIGIFWTFMLTGVVWGVALPAIFVRYGAPTKSVVQAVIRGFLVMLLFAYATCTVLLSLVGISDNLFGSIGPARDIHSLIMCSVGGIVLLLIGGLFGFPLIALGMTALLSSVCGFNLRQEDQDEAELAARRAQLKDEYRQINEGQVHHKKLFEERQGPE